MAGNFVAVSAISSALDGELIAGQVGRDIDFATAQQAARRTARNLLAVILESVGNDPSRVARILMVRGYVNAVPEFALVHQVIDAASEVLIAEFGERGRHARTVIGCATLPNRNAVTLDATVAVQ